MRHKPNDKELVRFRDEAAKLIRDDGEDRCAREQEQEDQHAASVVTKRVSADTTRSGEKADSNHRGTETETPNEKNP